MYHTLQMPSEQTDAISNSPYLTIEELSSAVKKTIEGRFEFVRVRGEVSQLRVPASGHVYFALKDEKNTLSSVIWRGSAARLSVQPEEGLDVICSGKMTTFGGQSRYQLIVNDVEIAGEGALLKQLEERRRKLADEGLFDAARKRPLPSFPRSIGVVTSPTGAVIRDILHRLSERFGVRVLVWGVNVQGAGSAEQIAAAIEGFNKLPETGEVARPDLLIVARGGGSIEDLWSFNEEIVVRAAAASVIPLISAVGHETDTTLIDYASDLRAPTPTAAAELATPVAADIKASLTDRQARLERAASRQIEAAQQSLRGLQRGLLHPRELIARHQQSVDIAASSVYNGLLRRLEGAASRFSNIAERLGSPSQRLAQVSERLLVCGSQLDNLIARQFDIGTQKLAQNSRLLEANSYQRVLERGFALVTDASGAAIKRSAEAPKGAEIAIQFVDGARHASLDSGDAPAKEPKKDTAKKPRKKTRSPDQNELF